MRAMYLTAARKPCELFSQLPPPPPVLPAVLLLLLVHLSSKLVADLLQESIWWKLDYCFSQDMILYIIQHHQVVLIES